MIVVVVLVLFGALAYIGSRRSPTTRSTHQATGHPSTTAAVHPRTTATTRPGTPVHTSHAQPGKRKVTTPPTTQPSQIVATSSTSTTASYPVTSAAYQVTITATGPCWVNATSASSGSTLWTGTLQVGGVQSFQGSGTVRLELGSPSVSVDVDSVPVVFPSPMHAPFIATFVPGAPAPNATSAIAAPTTTTTG